MDAYQERLSVKITGLLQPVTILYRGLAVDYAHIRIHRAVYDVTVCIEKDNTIEIGHEVVVADPIFQNCFILRYHFRIPSVFCIGKPSDRPQHILIGQDIIRHLAHGVIAVVELYRHLLRQEFQIFMGVGTVFPGIVILPYNA